MICLIAAPQQLNRYKLSITIHEPTFFFESQCFAGLMCLSHHKLANMLFQHIAMLDDKPLLQHKLESPNFRAVIECAVMMFTIMCDIEIVFIAMV